MSDLKAIRRQIRRVRSHIDLAQSELDTLRRLVPPDQPGPFTVSLTGEDLSMNTILFDVQLPALVTPHDVVKRQLSIVVDGGEPTVHDAEPAALAITGLRAPQDSSVELSLVDVDDGGNLSEPRTLDFVARDTVPPPQPGELGVRVTGEDLE